MTRNYAWNLVKNVQEVQFIVSTADVNKSTNNKMLCYYTSVYLNIIL